MQKKKVNLYKGRIKIFTWIPQWIYKKLQTIKSNIHKVLIIKYRLLTNKQPFHKWVIYSNIQLNYKNQRLLVLIINLRFVRNRLIYLIIFKLGIRCQLLKVKLFFKLRLFSLKVIIFFEVIKYFCYKQDIYF